MVYSCFATSKHLSMGPMAITSLLLGISCQKFGFEEASPEYIQVAISISFLVGFITLCLGLFKLGSLTNVISHSVLVGFLSASALVIALSQMKYILGIKVPRFTYTHQTIYYILSHLPETNGIAVFLGVVSFAFLYGLRQWKRNNKITSQSPTWQRALNIVANTSNLLAIVIGSLVAMAFVVNGFKLQIVGAVPSGLQAPSFPIIPAKDLISLVPSSLALAFVAFANNWAIAVKYANTYDYPLEATQELVASGLATMIGVPFNSFVVAGGLARSAVSVESGAMTQMSSIICATLMLIALFLFTRFFYYIPMAVLAAIIEVSILSMVDFRSMIDAYRRDKRDCLVMIGTFITTFLVGVIDGLFVGIFLSFAIVMRSVAFPHIVHLGKLPEDEGGHYKDVHRFPEAEQIPGVGIVRMDASLFFGNSAHFKGVVKDVALGKFHSNTTEPIQIVVIDASAWIDIDLIGLQTLFEIKEELNKLRGIRVVIACAKGVIRDHLRESGFGGMCMLCMCIDDAVHGKAALSSRVFGNNSSDGKCLQREDDEESSNNNVGIVTSILHRQGPGEEKVNFTTINSGGGGVISNKGSLKSPVQYTSLATGTAIINEQQQQPRHHDGNDHEDDDLYL